MDMVRPPLGIIRGAGREMTPNAVFQAGMVTELFRAGSDGKSRTVSGPVRLINPERCTSRTVVKKPPGHGPVASGPAE